MLTPLPILLCGGPHDGHRAAIIPPAPDALTVRFCPRCRRDHPHLPADVPGELLYLRVDWQEGRLRYEHVDVDATIAACFQTSRDRVDRLLL